jgi:uncharacterized protein YjbI with pentapeptide repeats
LHIATDQLLTVGWAVGRNKDAQLLGTFIAKSCCRIQHGQVADADSEMTETNPVTGDLFIDEDESKGLKYPSDFATFKPNSDVLILGTGYAAGAKLVPSFPVRVKVGGLQKVLEVVGNRTWEAGLFTKRPGHPQPVGKMPLTFENAWGGTGYSKNPIGRGRNTEQMHNLEFSGSRIERTNDRSDPAGFGPLASSWEPRKSKVGTCKGKWLKERWPWFPEDLDWSYFNAAPLDQQVDGYLRGDEELEFENLHPKHSIYKSRLPGLRTRCFLNERLQNGELTFREVKTNLDTLWINMDEEKLILVWRGLAPVRTLKLREIEHIYAVTEPLAEPPRSLEQHRAEFQRRLNEGQEVELPDAEAAATDAAFEKQFAEMDKEFAEAEQEMAKFEAGANQVIEEQKARAIAEGVDPKLFEDRAAPQTLAQVKAEYQAAMAELKRADPEQATQMGEIDFSQFEQMEAEAAQMEAEFAADNPVSPSRESVQAGLKGGTKSFAGHELSGLDLAGLDLTGADLSGASLDKANLRQAKLVGANLREANLSGADLTEADLTGAILDEADFSNAKLDKARMIDVSIVGTGFSRLELAAMDFSGAKGKGADFSKANLAGALFVRAQVPQSDFSGAVLEKADFSSAGLPAAQFDGAKAKGVQMENADVSGLHGGDKADFTGGNFRNAKGAGSIWEQSMLDGADFSKALLTRANFNETSLCEARFDRVDAMKASFDDAFLQRAVLTNANLLRATFDRADLTQTNLSNSNLYGAGFWETVFQHTVIDGANVKATQIAK